MHASLCTRALITLSKGDRKSVKSKPALNLLMAGKWPYILYSHAASSAVWDSVSSSWTCWRVVTQVCLLRWWWCHSLVLEKRNHPDAFHDAMGGKKPVSSKKWGHHPAKCRHHHSETHFYWLSGHLSGGICQVEHLVVPNSNHRPEFGFKYRSFFSRPSTSLKACFIMADENLNILAALTFPAWEQVGHCQHIILGHNWPPSALTGSNSVLTTQHANMSINFASFMYSYPKCMAPLWWWCLRWSRSKRLRSAQTNTQISLFLTHLDVCSCCYFEWHHCRKLHF